MHAPRIVRSVLLCALLLGVSVLPGLAPGAGATGRGGIVLHPRLCPFGVETDLFARCHGTPGPDDVTFRVDGRREKGLDARGNVSFGRVTAGDRVVVLTTDYQPNEFLQLRAVCTNRNRVTGETFGPNEAPIQQGDQASFYVLVRADSTLTCDVYFLRESGR